MPKPYSVKVVRGGSGSGVAVSLPTNSQGAIVVSTRAPELSVRLAGVTYPASLVQIIAAATAAGATARELTILGNLPNTSYSDAGDVLGMAGEG